MLSSGTMPELASRVYLFHLLAHGQLEQQCSQPQDDFVGWLSNLKVRGNP